MTSPTPVTSGATYAVGTTGVNRAAETPLVPWPTGTRAGDLLVALCTAEAGLIPDLVTGSTGKQVLASDASSTNFARQVSVLRLTQADVDFGGFKASVSAQSATRRMAVYGDVWRDAALEAHAHGTPDTGGTVTSRTSPAVTPTVADCAFIGLGAYFSTGAPYQRDYGVSTTDGWAKVAEGESGSTGAVNAFAVGARRILTGGANGAANGATFTNADNLRGYASTVALRYQPNAPVVTGPADRTADPYEIVTLAATADRGAVVWSQQSGPPITQVTTPATGSVRFLTPATMDGGTVVMRASATDNGSTGVDDVTITVRPHNHWSRTTANAWAPVQQQPLP